MVSVAATELKSVSRTPDFRLSTSMFEMVLLSASMALFVSVVVLESEMYVERSGPVSVNVSPETTAVMFCVPVTLNVSF